MLLVDTHVHLRSCFSVSTFLEAARHNFQCAGGRGVTGVLLFAEAEADRGFGALTHYLEHGFNHEVPEWYIPEGGDANVPRTVVMRFPSGETIVAIAGWQVHSAEQVEVLALVAGERPARGFPLEQLAHQIREGGGLPVIPWGAGKWIGHRDKAVARCVRTADQRPLFLGDTAHRQRWLMPRPFRAARQQGVPILPGSDPLPFREEVNRVGAFGLRIQHALDLAAPAVHVRELLCSVNRLSGETYGTPVGLPSFLRLQSLMQLRKLTARGPYD